MAKKKERGPSPRPGKRSKAMQTRPSKARDVSKADGREKSGALPTPLQVSAYTAGLRLSQALIISGLDSSLFISTAELLATLQRLIQAFDEFAVKASIEPRIRGRAGDVLDRCWATALQISQNAVNDNEGFGGCHKQLDVLRQMVVSGNPGGLDDRESQQAWFELGMKIADGVWDDPYCLSADGVWDDPHYPPMKRLREGEAYWAFDDQVRVDELLNQLDVALSRLMRAATEGPDQHLFAGVPRQFCGWMDIEAGLRTLIAEVKIADALNPNGQQVWITENGSQNFAPSSNCVVSHKSRSSTGGKSSHSASQSTR